MKKFDTYLKHIDLTCSVIIRISTELNTRVLVSVVAWVHALHTDFEPFALLTEEVGALWDGEVIAGWDLQRSHHIDLGAHPLNHSGEFSVLDSEKTGRAELWICIHPCKRKTRCDIGC